MGDESETGAKLLVKRKPRTGFGRFGSREADPLGIVNGEKGLLKIFKNRNSKPKRSLGTFQPIPA